MAANVHWCNLRSQIQGTSGGKRFRLTNSNCLMFQRFQFSMAGRTKYVCIPENHQDIGNNSILGHCDNEENVQRSHQIRVSLLLTGRSRLYVQPACSLSTLSTLSSLSSLLAKGFLGQTVWRPLRQIPDYKTPIWKTEYQNNGTDYHHHASYDDDDANYKMYNFLLQFPRLYFITPPVLKAFPGKLL